MPGTTDIPDGELLERWRRGDSAAGELLFDRYYRCIDRFFLNKVGAASADLVQETFAACVEGRDRISDPALFRSYVFGIAYKVYFRYLRKKSSRVEPEVTCVSEVVPTPRTVVVRRGEQRLLLEALRDIPINFQVTLELHYWEQLSTREIADALGSPPATARSRLQRARDALSAAMARHARSGQELHSTLTTLDDWAARCREALTPHRTGEPSR